VTDVAAIRCPEIFGVPWDAPICEAARMVETPSGTRCFSCSEPIRWGDNGVLLPSELLDATSERRREPLHRECYLREVVGSLDTALDRGHPCSAREAAKVIWDHLAAYGTV
jgi:hypothetical protein